MRVGIIGGGIAGLSTAWALTKAGHAVTLFEQSSIPNPQAASGDQHRIIRQGYADQDGYARLITQAFAAWQRLWDDLGHRHYKQTGVLCVSQEPGDEADEYLAGYDRMGTAYERLEPAAAMARYPFLDADCIRYAAFCPDGGVLFSRRIAVGLTAWLRQHGAVLHEQHPVLDIDTDNAVINTADGAHQLDQLVITAGAWLGELLPAYKRHVTSHRTAVVYLSPPQAYAQAWSEAPVFLSAGGTDLDGYILPPADGTDLKFGAGRFKEPSLASHARASSHEEGQAIRDAFAPIFRNLDDYTVRDTRSCVYSFTADERFFAAVEGRAWVISACSGHGYKFGAAIGEQVARAIDQKNHDGLIRWLEARA